MHCKEIFSFLTLALLPLISVSAPFSVMAQSVICEVTVEATRLPPKEQNDLRNLARSMESYINEFEYTDESYDVTFQMKIQVFVETVSEAGSEKLYHAQAAISNNYDQRYFDKRWIFVYRPNEPLYHSGVFHTITGFLDFYVNLQLGGEFDLIEPLQGSRYYSAAREIAGRAKNSAYSQGWNNRAIRVDELTSNWRLREAKGKYSDFLYFLSEENKPDEALTNFRDFLKLFRDIFDLNSLDKYSIEFLNAHATELCDALFYYRDPDLYEDLITVNPTNRETYQSYLDRLEY